MGTSTIDVQTILSNILSGTNTSFATFEPLFVFLGGLLLAMIAIHFLIQALTGRRSSMFDNDDEEVW
jgi:ABC-type nickel/cobalt efflux system permease component RcnA